MQAGSFTVTTIKAATEGKGLRINIYLRTERKPTASFDCYLGERTGKLPKVERKHGKPKHDRQTGTINDWQVMPWLTNSSEALTIKAQTMLSLSKGLVDD